MKSFMFSIKCLSRVLLKGAAALLTTFALGLFMPLEFLHGYLLLSVIGVTLYVSPTIFTYLKLRGVAVTFSDQGIMVSGKNAIRTIRWEDIIEIQSMNDHIAVLVKEGKRVPLPGDFRKLPNFKETMEEYCKEHRINILREIT